jgi:hypothetical protein
MFYVGVWFVWFFIVCAVATRDCAGADLRWVLFWTFLLTISVGLIRKGLEV